MITLLSDFGLKDPYVAEMKAVILSINPQVRIVDISHQIEKFNIQMGAVFLARTVPYFPSGTIHVAVIDPGVGTKRRPIVVKTRRSFYVGPDNGLLMLAARKEGQSQVHVIKNTRYLLPHISRTFHGRDIFAPAAAYLTCGISPAELGPEISEYLLPEFAEPRVTGRVLLGKVLHIDDFGNVISNITAQDLQRITLSEDRSLLVELKGKRVELKLCVAYSEVPTQTPLAIIGSSGFLEFSIHQGNASEVLDAQMGTSVRVSAP